MPVAHEITVKLPVVHSLWLELGITWHKKNCCSKNLRLFSSFFLRESSGHARQIFFVLIVAGLCDSLLYCLVIQKTSSYTVTNALLPCIRRPPFLFFRVNYLFLRVDYISGLMRNKYSTEITHGII